MNVQWERIAKPQPDQYDTAVTLEFLKKGRYGNKPVLLADGPLVWPDGRARWAQLKEMPAPNFVTLPQDDGRVIEALRLLNLWPEMRKQAADLMLGISALTMMGAGGGHGCCCGNYHDDFGWLYVTCDDVWGFAEGIVHETAHWKLRAFGIQFEEWDGLLLDHSLTQLYDSPVRKDKPRPMGAVLHAQYSYVHVCEMVRRMYEAKLAVGAADAADAGWLSLQMKRITEGQRTLRAHAKGTPEGHFFLQGLDEWTTEVLETSRSALPAAVEFA